MVSNGFNIECGDYVDFGKYGCFYVTGKTGKSFKVVDKKEDRVNICAKIKYIQMDKAVRIIEKYDKP